MAIKDSELHFLFILIIGFGAFSLPLLIHDTSHLWGSDAPTSAGEGYPPGYDSPPGPPPWQSYDDEDAGAKFRHAVADGDMTQAEKLHTEALLQDPPVDLVTMAHWHGATPLFEAARGGHVAMATWLVSKGADADKVNEWGDSAANEAASMGHWDIVWYLADHGADLKRKTEHAHSTLVLSAVRHKSTDALAQLQRRGVNLDQKSWNGGTPLHEAARTGDVAVVDWFLTSSTLDINATNDQGEAPVHEAAMMGHAEVVKRLLAAGAHLGEAGSQAVSGTTYSAVQHGNLELLELLSSRGVLDVEAPSHGRLPLIEAVRHGEMSTVEWLLAHGANVSAQTDSNETPLGVAAFEDRLPMMWMLHAKGASLEVTNEYGGTVLMSAVHFGRADDVTRLVAAGLDVNAANHRGDTPLTLAASRDDLPLVKTLVGLGAKADARGTRLDTPLIRAAHFRRLETVSYLLDNRLGDLHAVNRRGDSALLEACRAGAYRVAEVLLKHGAKVNHENKQGMTCLLEAAEGGGSVELIDLLINTPDINIHARSKLGDGAIEVSRWSKNAEAIHSALKAVGVKPVDPSKYDPDRDDHKVHDDDYHHHREDDEPHHEPHEATPE